MNINEPIYIELTGLNRIRDDHLVLYLDEPIMTAITVDSIMVDKFLPSSQVPLCKSNAGEIKCLVKLDFLSSSFSSPGWSFIKWYKMCCPSCNMNQYDTFSLT